MKGPALLLLALSAAANAQPITYDESIDGDLQSGAVLTFGLGANTVSGTVSCRRTGELTTCDFDKFEALLPEFSVLASISLRLTDANASGQFASLFEVYGRPSTIILQQSLNGAGDYDWTIGQSYSSLFSVGLNAFPANLENDYTLVFNVSPTALRLGLLGDINGDGSQDIAALVEKDGRLTATTKDAEDGRRLNQIRFDAVARLVDLEVMADINGNGAPELVALGTRPTNAEIRDSLTGQNLGVTEFDSARSPFDLELLVDQTGNGIPELAVLGGVSTTSVASSSVAVELQDPATPTPINTLAFNAGYLTRDLSIWNQADGVALGVLGEFRDFTRSDKIEVRNLDTGQIVSHLWLGKVWRPLQMELLADLNGNGSPEAAVLREHPEDGRVSVLLVDTASGVHLRHLGFDPNYRPVRLRVLEDVNGNGTEEIALLAVRRGSGNQKVWVKDAATGQSVRQVYFGKTYIGEDMIVSPDMSGNGMPELIVLGRRIDGAVTAIIKDSMTGKLIRTIGF